MNIPALPSNLSTSQPSQQQQLHFLRKINFPCQLQGKSNTIGCFLGKNVPTEMLTLLKTSSNTLAHSSNTTTHRYYIGYWRHSSPILYKSSDFKNPHVIQWVTINNALWSFAANQLLLHYPTVHCALSRVRIPHLFGGVWSMACLNYNFGIGAHKDNRDYFPGICCVIVFGLFTGGQLCFPEDDLMIQTVDGSMVLFFSAQNLHMVNKYSGVRNSVTLFTPHNVVINDS